jgi:hypothetical protein
VQLKDLPAAATVFLRRPVVLVLIAGLVIRLVLMPTLSPDFDMMHWALAIQHIQAGAGLYDILGYWYTPVWGYILGGTAYLMNLLGITDYGYFFAETAQVESLRMGHTMVITTMAFNFIVKIPALISDVVVGYIIYRFISERTGDKKKATYGFALWFLCPLVIYVSAVHGMFDSIYVMFMVLSVYSLYKGHDFLAGVSLSVAVLLKVFPIYIIFVLIAYIFTKHRGDMRTIGKRILTAAVGVVLMSLLIYIPQILDGTVMESLLFFTTRVDASPAVETGSNLWHALVSFSTQIMVWLQVILLTLTCVFVYLIYRKGGKDKDEDKTLFACLMISTAIPFLWSATPHLLVMALPFLICFIAMYDKRFIIPFAVIVATATIREASNLSIFMSLAAYTSLMDLGSVVSVLVWTDQQFMMGLTRQGMISSITGIVGAIGAALVLLYWLRHEKEAKTND